MKKITHSLRCYVCDVPFSGTSDRKAKSALTRHTRTKAHKAKLKASGMKLPARRRKTFRWFR